MAASFPEKLLFLDVKTTGSSPYYGDLILAQWVMGGERGCYIKGQDPSSFLNALSRAGGMVCLERLQRGMAFVRQLWPGAEIPEVSLDLSSHVGKSKKRDGAPWGRGGVFKSKTPPVSIRWQAYVQGEANALDGVVGYSTRSLVYLAEALDDHIRHQGEMQGVPAQFLSSMEPFSARVAGVMERKGMEWEGYGGAPPMTYGAMEKGKADQATVLGIDLVASEKKESGVCLLRQGRAQTWRMRSNGAFLALAQEEKVSLVCIDAPLGLPLGRTHCFDDDPQREQRGIIRECERILRRRGVGVYPALIKCMQNLTHRAMGLKHQFAEMGVEVIEVYPGGTQDCMGIPRKQAGVSLLARGLKHFGLHGISEAMSHDELDAVTAALTGVFYLEGMCERLGVEEEGVLIMPKPSRFNAGLTHNIQ